MSEHLSQVAVFDVLRLNEQRDPRLRWVYAVPNGGSRHPATAGKLKAEGVRRGIADICVPFGSSVRGDLFAGAYIEMKFGKNKTTPEQKEFLSFVAGQGFATCVAYSADEALDFIEDYTGTRLRGRG